MTLELEPLGICRRNVRALLLLPIAYVAWASRRRDVHALDVLLTSAATQAHIEPEGLALAKGWVRTALGKECLTKGIEQLASLARAPDEPLFAPSDLLKAVVWASSAAQLDRQPLGRGYGPVSSAAREAIRELELALGVDIGDLWADVMAELGEELPRSGNAVPPRFRTTPDSSRELDAGALEPAVAELTAPVDSLTFTHRGPVSTPFPLIRRTGT